MNGLDACKRQTRPTGAKGMIAQSVADILADHVALSVEGIDRMYLNVYVPLLQSELGVVRFFRDHRGQPLPSAVLMSPMSRRFVAALEAFVAGGRGTPRRVPQGEGKKPIMTQHIRTSPEGEKEGFVCTAR